MKPITINEVRYGKSNLVIPATKLVKQFVESGYEAIEVEDKDLEKNNGWISKMFGGKSFSNASYARKKIDEVIISLQLEEMVASKVCKGKIFLYRKDM